MILPKKWTMINRDRERAWRYWLAIIFDKYLIQDFVEDHIAPYDERLAKEIHHRIRIEKCCEMKAEDFFKKYPFFSTDQLETCLVESFFADELLDYTVGVV